MSKKTPAIMLPLDAVIKQQVTKAFDLNNSFSDRIFHTKIASAGLELHKSLVDSVIRNVVADSKTKFNYLFFNILNTIVKHSSIQPDEIAAIIMRREDIKVIFDKNSARVNNLLLSCTDEFYGSLFNNNYLLFQDNLADVLKKLSLIKKFKINPDALDIVLYNFEKYITSNETNIYFNFRSCVSGLVFLSKQCAAGKKLFKDKFFVLLQIAINTKTSYYKRQHRYAMIKAIKDVRDKALRKEFIRAMIAKGDNDFNQTLIKYYPKYTAYVAMT